MQRKYAILIDAGFLKRKLGSPKSPITSQKIVDFTEKLQNRPELVSRYLHRIYYYDAEPLSVKKSKPLTGGRKFNFASTSLYKPNMQILDDLKRKPYFAVRLGEANFRGWLVKSEKLDVKDTSACIQIESTDLIPNVQQKGVDMRIGLDISSLSLKNQVDIIVLVTGDSDFIPALKFARREGKQIVLYTLGHGIRPEMYAHTDLCIKEMASNL